MNGNRNHETPQNENVIAGIVGALLFSLVGGIAWFLLYQVGIIAAVSGLIGVILAIKGYSLFAKKESIKGIIIASVIALLVIGLAWYICLGKDIYDVYQEWFKEKEIDYTLTFSESLKAVPLFLEDPEVGPECYKDLAFGLIFALIGSIGTVITSVKKVKNRKLIPEEAVPVNNIEAANAQSTESVAPIRSAATDEKVHIFTQTKAYGHEIVYRRVGNDKEELVIDNMVYAECECKKSAFKGVKPHEMTVYFDGHKYCAGVFKSNYIAVDNVSLTSTARMN